MRRAATYNSYTMALRCGLVPGDSLSLPAEFEDPWLIERRVPPTIQRNSEDDGSSLSSFDSQDPTQEIEDDDYGDCAASPDTPPLRRAPAIIQAPEQTESGDGTEHESDGSFRSTSSFRLKNCG
tara:strand:+ start:14721 stop:15092 length:372 start_codon:yes stop_codon:yes gene_type:complete